MLSGDRPIINTFDPTEQLYMRYRIEQFLNGHLDPAAIRADGQSVNRSTLSEPEDTLFHEQGRYNGWGVVAFEVAIIPKEVPQAQGPSYTFFPIHVPLDVNYGHSEIAADHIPSTGTLKKPSKTVAVAFRINLSRYITENSIRILAAG